LVRKPNLVTIGPRLVFGAHACFGRAGGKVQREYTLVKYAVRHVPLQPRLPRSPGLVVGWNPGSSHGGLRTVSGRTGSVVQHKSSICERMFLASLVALTALELTLNREHYSTTVLHVRHGL
jgi:hypothetical protein